MLNVIIGLVIGANLGVIIAAVFAAGRRETKNE